eukprot:scaffold5295_cov390-Prasinococcus_capsulatus_cf.AAC.1
MAWRGVAAAPAPSERRPAAEGTRGAGPPRLEQAPANSKAGARGDMRAIIDDAQAPPGRAPTWPVLALSVRVYMLLDDSDAPCLALLVPARLVPYRAATRSCTGALRYVLQGLACE